MRTLSRSVATTVPLLPQCFDDGDALFVLYACTDPSHCPFALEESSIGNAQNEVPVLADPLPVPPTLVQDSCSSITSCGDCSNADNCAWCIGTLFESDSDNAVSGASRFPVDEDHICEGTTLTSSCDVYKCPWYEYYLQDPSQEGDCSSLACTATTGDDPDFVRTDTPAQPHSTPEACQGSCVDPTTSCDSVNNTCARTYTCNVSATCATCSDLHLPTSFKGVEISADYAKGVWALDFDAAYTTPTLTASDGTTQSTKISSWLFDGSSEYSGQWVFEDNAAQTTTVHAVRMFVASSGALGQNAYLAISTDATPMEWGQGIDNAHNGTEFALLACQFDSAGNPVSGLYDPIECAI